MKKSFEKIFPGKTLENSGFDVDKIPQSVAVIMDGNGRWAKKRSLMRLSGHKAGISAVRELIRTSSDIGIKYLTIYSFSTENWKRDAGEVQGLMNLFAKTMLAEVDELHFENVKVVTIGDVSALPQKTQEAFSKAYELTKSNTGLTLVVAVNYGARAEILRAVQQICLQKNDDNVKITEDYFEKFLYTSNIPDPELIIRTSGEMRLSNFLLWQAAYSEFVCVDTLWPDFDRYTYLSCLVEYMSRNRRFGGTK